MVDFGSRVALQLEAVGQAVLPEGDDGIRCGRARSHGHNDRRVLRSGHLVDEDGRAAVEQVDVVDAEDQSAPARALGDGEARTQQQLETRVELRLWWQEHVREGPERDLGASLRRDHPFRRETGSACRSDALRREPRLSNTRGTRDDDATPPLGRVADKVELLITAHERPVHRGAGRRVSKKGRPE